ncbi:MAG: hypothetical protein RQ731_09240 [Anaerosomatales bacterium]|nr:hypothetical protein [Anaerosomatales bacterium]
MCRVTLQRMKRLPGHEHAIIPEEKLRYCLDPMHETGRHKAHMFRSALGIDLEDTPRLRHLIEIGISTNQAVRVGDDQDGIERWVVEWIVQGRLSRLRLITAWDLQVSYGPPGWCHAI